MDADGTQLILSSRLTNCAGDANALAPAVEAVSETVGKPRAVPADSAYANSAAFGAQEEAQVDACVAVSRDESHTQRRYEFRPERSSSKKVITDAGRKMYPKR